MKVQLLVLCALVAVAAASRAVINHDIIQAVNSDPTSTWKAGVNSVFEGMTTDDIRAMLNVQVSEREEPLGMVGPEAAAKMQAEAEAIAASLPDSYDAEKAYPKCGDLLSPSGILNQGQCGSCWAFSASEVLSDQLCFASDKQVVLSAQDLVSCDKTNMGCNGGYLDRVWTWMEKHGVTSEECLPYTSRNGTTGSCPATCADGSAIKRYFAKDAKHVTSTIGRADKIAANIAEHGVAQAAFRVYEDFMSYKSGVYEHKTGSLLGGHAVKIVGFGELNGVKYWKVANSWGSGWGMDGFFLIKRGDNQCGFEADVWTGLVASSTPA